MAARRRATAADGSRTTTHPPKARSAADRAALARLRPLALALEGTQEVEAWGEPTWRAGRPLRLYAMFASGSSPQSGGRPAVWIKATPVNQALLLEAEPVRTFRPPYVGASGWIGVWLDRRPRWTLVRTLLEDGWRLVTTRR
jgi:predicted DNA-binding protein (MmcQ/YjbR family)